MGPMVRLGAHWGGDRNRQRDPEPGHQLLWPGHATLTKATLERRIGVANARGRPGNLNPTPVGQVP